MGKYLDKTGLQYFYNKLKDKFADKSTIETKLDSLTGAFTWKGELSALPTDLSSYSAGNVIKVGTKEYVCTETNGTKSWDELGDEGSYLLKTAAESTYLKKAAGEVKTDNLADTSVTEEKLATSLLYDIIGKSTLEDYRKGTIEVYEKLIGLHKTDADFNKAVRITGDCSHKCILRIISNEVIYEEGTEDEYSDKTYDEYYFQRFPTYYSSDDDALHIQGIGYKTADDYDEDTTSSKDSIYDTRLYDILIFKSSDAGDSDYEYKSYLVISKYGEIKDKSITKVKLDDSVQTSLGKADNSLQIGETNTQSKTTVVKTESTSKWESGIKVENKSDSTEITPKGITFGQAQQPIGIYHEAALKLKLDSASGSNIQLTGLATPTNDTDAVNKKYIDSGFVKICQTNEPISKHEISTTFKVNNAGYGSLQVSDVNNKTTLLNGSSILIGSMSPSGEGANLLSNRGISFATATNSFGSIKVNSNNKLQITGLDTPTSDTDAANKKYVDDKTSDVLKSTTDNSIITDVTLLSDGSYGLSVKKSDDEYIKITPNNITLSCVQDGDTMSSIIYPTKDSGGGNALYVDCTLCGVQEPKSDTDATNKKYVDDKIVSEIYDRVTGYQTEFSDDLETTAYNVVPAINEVNTLAKAAVPKTDLATSLQAITIYIDNTAEHKAANLANIKAYEDNLKALGVDITKSPIIPIVIDQGDCGYIQRYPGEDLFTGLYRADDITTMVISIDSDGNYAEAGLATESDVISYPRQYNYTALTTTSKTVIGAINEVNTLAKSKASTSVATQSANGLMSADDKKKLDGALAAIANNASVNAIDIVSYDETTNTYSGNAIEITGNIKSEIDIKNHTYLAANSTVDGHIESLDIALKNISDKVTNVATAANTAGKDAAAAQSALNTFKNRTEGFATAAQGTKADNSVQYDTNGKDVNLPDDGTLTVFGQITSQIGKLQLGANGESSYDITITSSNIEESPAIVFSESSNDVVLTGVANPINNNDVANKQYVDSKDNSPFIIDLYSVTNYDSSKTYSTTLTKEQVEKIHTNKSFLIKFPETSNDTSTADKIVSVNGGHYVHYETLLDIYDPQHAEKNTLQRITNVCRGMNAQMTKLFTSVANVIINYDANGGVSYTLAISAVITKDLN